MQQTPTSLAEKVAAWFSESIVVKLTAIGFLILILLIPQAWIESIIRERQQRASSVVDEITSKWSGKQTLSGPVLIIPVTNREKSDKGKEGIEIREWTQEAFFLPEALSINGHVSPEILHRGIFDAAVYESTIQFNAQFNKPDFQKLNIKESDVHWNEARMALSISDLRGIKNSPAFRVRGDDLASEPSSQIGFSTITTYTQSTEEADYNSEYAAYNQKSKTESTGIVSSLPWKSAEDFSESVSLNLVLKGSTQLYFVPTGKNTEVKLDGPWPNPSFDGEFLPETRSVNDTSFAATWKILHYNRPFSQSWTEAGTELSGSDFGARLLIPVDQYQKSIRTAKYGVLIIILTFVSLFLVEIIRKIKIHSFQYLLIGVALIIYYTLLLSFSEHLGYNLAYLISSFATVILVSLYTRTFLSNWVMVGFFFSVITFFYGFIFVIIQLQDYSLLIGSIGLFLIIAAIMYFSRNIKWYAER
ncbi:MAG: cell envelope integrity protein CreD [Flammeovirgaceae bacterium]|nr:cell envelope integrity protein CreD [Flammeovirgaceae bacterium]